MFGGRQQITVGALIRYIWTLPIRHAAIISASGETGERIAGNPSFSVLQI